MRHAMTFLSAMVALTACTTNTPSTDAGADAGDLDANVPGVDAWVPPVPTTTIMAANAVGPSDPMWEGQQRFLYETWGTEAQGGWPPPAWLVGLQAREPAVFGNQFESFGFVHDPNDDLPVGLKRGIEDPSQLRETCALCHVGALPATAEWCTRCGAHSHESHQRRADGGSAKDVNYRLRDTTKSKSNYN